LQRGWFGIDNRGVPQRRSYSSSSARSKEYAPNPLDAFRDPVDRQTRMQEPVGRQWSVKELRRKSYEDLHRLWYVLYKEKNMLLTEQQLSRRRQLIFPQPDRFQKVQKGMGAIRQVLGERKRKVVAAHLERHREKELAKQMTAELDHQDAEFVEIEESDFGDETEINDKDSTK
jgi:large subunit ribosomal protein L47